MIGATKGVATERKARLYLCGGCRAIWDLLYDARSREAVEISERYVDGQATREELSHTAWSAEVPTFGYDCEPGIWRKWTPDGAIPPGVHRLVEMGVLTPGQLEQDEPEVDQVVRDRLLGAASLAEAAASRSPFEYDWWHRYIPKVPWPGESLLRCIFGDPFLPYVFFSAAWLTPNVVDLARTMYEERTFDKMPLLAESLKDAGCTNQEVLDHCRSPHRHARGCWVLDLALGES